MSQCPSSRCNGVRHPGAPTQRRYDSTETYANLCIGPDGGMISSAHDLLVSFDHLFGEKDLLSPETLAQMLPFVVWFSASSLLPG